MAERLVVFDSVFGNTGEVAKAIGEALSAEVKKVDTVSAEDLAGVKVLIIGAPTRAFQPTPAAKAFLKGLKGQLKGVKASAFDTRFRIEDTNSGFLRFMVRTFGYATPKLVKGLEKAGAEITIEAEGFIVVDTEGPLAEGELDRAKAWAAKILQS